MKTGVFGRAAMIGVLGAALAGAIGGAEGCSTNPTTGRSQLAVLSPEEEKALGAQEAPKLTEEFGGEVKNPALTGYINEVGQKLKAQTEVDGPERTWYFILLDSEVINAFALPGERVFMSQGLADKLSNEAELAGVLGHEIGHVMARHTSERLAQAQGASVLAQAAGVIAGATISDGTLAQAVPAVVGAGGQVVVLKFSRDQESEADTLGMRYMVRAMYNPRGQLEVMEVLKAASGTGGGTMEFLATHPLPTTRIDRVKAEIESTYAYTQSGPDAKNYQFFAERYKQRYLDVRGIKPAATPKAEAPVDASGRRRMLAAIDLDHPESWCAICAAQQGR